MIDPARIDITLGGERIRRAFDEGELAATLERREGAGQAGSHTWISGGSGGAECRAGSPSQVASSSCARTAWCRTGQSPNLYFSTV